MMAYFFETSKAVWPEKILSGGHLGKKDIKTTRRAGKAVKTTGKGSVKKGNVNTVEGNSGDAVRRRSYPIGDNEMYGYGVY